MSNNMIMPFKVNSIHYMAFQNNASSLEAALSSNTKYVKDSFGNTPLTYAMQRKSYDCIQTVLEYIMSKEDIYKSLDANEITDLIECSPANLLDFFNDAMLVHDQSVPSFGKILKEPVSFITTPNHLLTDDYV